MKTHWMLQTQGDPLAATRHFLQTLWQTAHLEGMVAPVYQAGQMSVETILLDDPQRLDQADPFVPVMPRNSALQIVQLAKERPQARLAAVLRACEMRALHQLVQRQDVELQNWLVIGADCMACFPIQDFEWRAQKAGGAEALTRQVLRNARQGGISPDRFRTSCQMCSKPEAQKVDLCLKLLGLPVKDVILVEARDQGVADWLNLGQITQGKAPEQYVEQHERMLTTLEHRRQRFHDRVLQELPETLPVTVGEFMAMIAQCSPCQKCLEACPVYRDELLPQAQGGVISMVYVQKWLASCGECGMCEQACPKSTPLAAIINRLSQQAKAELLAV